MRARDRRLGGLGLARLLGECAAVRAARGVLLAHRAQLDDRLRLGGVRLDERLAVDRSLGAAAGRLALVADRRCERSRSGVCLLDGALAFTERVAPVFAPDRPFGGAPTALDAQERAVVVVRAAQLHERDVEVYVGSGVAVAIDDHDGLLQCRCVESCRRYGGG